MYRPKMRKIAVFSFLNKKTAPEVLLEGVGKGND